ncbi:MAG: energy-coupling factor ABC transporter ATP-binding protein [Cetobacterium sp.]|uniref:energy-coupling factor ABC transporter ATP-binding protein n=1 Tax=Cetobacterium sp. TaxID=2071632 RepID=UPI003F2D6971
MEISLKKVNSGYDEIILENFNMEIEEGSWTFIIGKTGSGKSTLLQTIGFLLNNIQGEILWKGTNLSNSLNLKKFREAMGYMFQYTEKQFFNNTIKEEIEYFLIKKKVSREEIDRNVNEVLKLLKLSDEILNKSPYEISGGQKRLVALASILVTSPKLLLLDEPTAGLDLENKKLFFDILKQLKNKGVTIIQISHLLEDVLEYGDKVFLLENKKIINKGVPLKVLEKSDLEFIEFCKIINKFGIGTENMKNIDELLERIEINAKERF